MLTLCGGGEQMNVPPYWLQPTEGRQHRWAQGIIIYVTPSLYTCITLQWLQSWAYL